MDLSRGGPGGLGWVCPWGGEALPCDLSHNTCDVPVNAVDRMTDRHLWKHYLPATLFVSGGGAVQWGPSWKSSNISRGAEACMGEGGRSLYRRGTKAGALYRRGIGPWTEYGPCTEGVPRAQPCTCTPLSGTTANSAFPQLRLRAVVTILTEIHRRWSYCIVDEYYW